MIKNEKNRNVPRIFDIIGISLGEKNVIRPEVSFFSEIFSLSICNPLRSFVCGIYFSLNG